MSQPSGVLTPITNFPHGYVNNGFSFGKVFVNSTGANVIAVTQGNNYTYTNAVSGVTITVPANLSDQTGEFVVADWGGVAGTGATIVNITGATAAVTFNGALSIALDTPYEKLNFYSSGTSDWRVL